MSPIANDQPPRELNCRDTFLRPLPSVCTINGATHHRPQLSEVGILHQQFQHFSEPRWKLSEQKRRGCPRSCAVTS